jgi:hypothetical protein
MNPACLSWFSLQNDDINIYFFDLDIFTFKLVQFLSHLSQICPKFCPDCPQNHCPWQEKCKKDKEKRDSDTPLQCIDEVESIILHS